MSIDVAKLSAIIAEPLTQVSYINTITLHIFLLKKILLIESDFFNLILSL